jgi:hypothetical protein
MEELIQCIDSYKEISNDLDIAKAETLTNLKDFPCDITDFLSAFSYPDKDLIIGESKTTPNQRNTPDSIYNEEEIVKKEKKPFFLDKLPTSISEKSELRKYNQERHIIRKPNTNIDLNIPQNLNLQGIADYNFQNNQTTEDYLNGHHHSDNSESYAPLSKIINDDLNYEYQTPIDFLKNYNVQLH